jgi:hypothetical protein
MDTTFWLRRSLRKTTAAAEVFADADRTLAVGVARGATTDRRVALTGIARALADLIPISPPRTPR